jgi:hypothetical protein
MKPGSSESPHGHKTEGAAAVACSELLGNKKPDAKEKQHNPSDTLNDARVRRTEKNDNERRNIDEQPHRICNLVASAAETRNYHGNGKGTNERSRAKAKSNEPTPPR